MRPIFCGNFEYDARQSDLERIFGRYGKVDRVDMKSGFAFIYMDDEHDAADAIRGLDRSEFGKHGRRLRVEWTKQERERGIRRPAGARRSSGNLKPTKTLFVINFDPVRTRTRDLEAHFDPFGKILNIRIKRNFAFVQFELQEDATKALEATNLSKVMDRVISVEYAVRDDDDKRNGYSPVRRGRERSSERSRDRGRSPSPYGRAERGSPDYGRGSSPRGRVEQRGSPDYGRGPSPRGRVEQRGSPDYGRGLSPRGRSEQRGSPDYGHGPSSRGRIEQRGSPDYGQGSSPLGRAEQRGSPEYGHGPSPPGRPEKRGSPNYERGPSPRGRPEKRGSPNYEHSPSPRGRPEKRVSPDYERGPSPRGRPEKRGSPDYDRSESPAYERFHSRSPVKKQP